MSEAARILRFPERVKDPASRAEALADAARCLREVAVADDESVVVVAEEILNNPDILLAACHLIGQELDVEPARSLRVATALYRGVLKSPKTFGFFDERDYFLGETALLNGRACRFLGKRADAEIWLDRSEAGFRNTVNPSPMLSRVSLQRLALRCDMGRYGEVAELAPMLKTTFQKLGMPREALQCLYVEATSLKHTDQISQARERFDEICRTGDVEGESLVTGMAFVSMAELHAADGDFELAITAFRKATPCLKAAGRQMYLAHLKASVAEMLLRQGQVEPAIDAYQDAASEYEELGMSTWVAYLRVETAGAMIQAGKHKEAAWQIAAALPTIDQEGMTPEGLAAVALLVESAKRRNLNQSALDEVREYLRTKR